MTRCFYLPYYSICTLYICFTSLYTTTTKQNCYKAELFLFISNLVCNILHIYELLLKKKIIYSALYSNLIPGLYNQTAWAMRPHFRHAPPSMRIAHCTPPCAHCTCQNVFCTFAKIYRTAYPAHREDF